ncbi:site-specific integrase [Psychrobacillus sp. Sa2BUA9]|uniref:Site-specific integrase n=1 Tax=Psychrobacillus faecigallinarum TaxID=2762235 RepID=A0ABR8RAD9_9BACI|nr:site-specific integrase [Psychrobacillus faecigallinarum]MBD7944754.1 site-specific integrase [Psychrobacillus faecigallinarum]
MARQQYNKTKKDNIYWYKDNKIKKFAYRYKYYDAYGQRKEKSKQGFDTEKSAELSLTELKAEILKGNHQRVDNQHLTISKWMEMWYERNESKWKISTRAQYQNAIEHHIAPNLGHIKLSQLTKSTYQSLIDKLISSHAPTSIRTMHAVFNSAINAAVEEEILTRNKITKVNLPQLNPKHLEVGDNFLSEEELRRLLEYVKKNEEFTHYMLILLLAFTGMRKGEALALRWANVDFDNAEITIIHTRDHLGERSAKTDNSIRRIDVSDSLITHLKKYKLWAMKKKLSQGIKLNEDNLILINPSTCEPISRSFPNYLTERAFEAGVIKRITPHALRHTCATILISKGIPVTTVAKMLGDSVEMVLKVYAHSLRVKEKEAAKVLGEVINFE